MKSISRSLCDRSIQDAVRRTMARSGAFQAAGDPSQRILRALEALDRIDAAPAKAANSNYMS